MTDAQMLSVLVLPLVLLLFEYHKLHLLLFMVIAVVLGGRNGILAGSTLWVAYSVVRLGVDFVLPAGAGRVDGV